MLKRPTSPADLPKSVPVFPLTGALLLPFSHRPLNIFEPRYVEMVDAALRGDRLIGLIQPEDTSEESPKGRSAAAKDRLPGPAHPFRGKRRGPLFHHSRGRHPLRAASTS